MPYASSEKKRQYHAKYYLKNKASILEKNREWARKNPDKKRALHRKYSRYQEFHHFLAGVKLFYGCSNPDCKWDGSFESCMLEFHHINPAEKLFSVGQFNRSRTKAELTAEINKCCVLCSNCHKLDWIGQLNCSTWTRCNLTSTGEVIGPV